MSLAKSTKIGPYGIIAPLGPGGMREVYRARDTRLSRDVALKILPEFFNEDSDRLRRFEQEAVLFNVEKLHIRNGARQKFVSVSPADPSAITLLFPPIFSADEKNYIYTQMRDFSTLYLAQRVNRTTVGICAVWLRVPISFTTLRPRFF